MWINNDCAAFIWCQIRVIKLNCTDALLDVKEVRLISAGWIDCRRLTVEMIAVTVIGVELFNADTSVSCSAQVLKAWTLIERFYLPYDANGQSWRCPSGPASEVIIES